MVLWTTSVFTCGEREGCNASVHASTRVDAPLTQHTAARAYIRVADAQAHVEAELRHRRVRKDVASLYIKSVVVHVGWSRWAMLHRNEQHYGGWYPPITETHNFPAEYTAILAV